MDEEDAQYNVLSLISIHRGAKGAWGTNVCNLKAREMTNKMKIDLKKKRSIEQTKGRVSWHN